MGVQSVVSRHGASLTLFHFGTASACRYSSSTVQHLRVLSSSTPQQGEGIIRNLKVSSTNHQHGHRSYHNDGGHADEHHEHNSSRSEYLLGPNPGLASIISQGIKSLEQTAADIQQKTRKASLFQLQKKSSLEKGISLLDPRQLAEGQRVLDVASDCLDHIVRQGTMTDRQRRGLTPAGGDEPIVLLDCVVNRNVRQAKLYWTLPYRLLLDEKINQKIYQLLMVKVQGELVHPEGGGAKLLARHVHARLASYYPPRLKMVPATDEMVKRAIEEYMS
jgi:hypothetical protein